LLVVKLQEFIMLSCGPSTPFEGPQIYVVEKCDNEEIWHGQYGQQQYTTFEECTDAIVDNKVCQQLPK
jgi:hypothetical protein